MTYWHIQLHPDEAGFSDEIKILKETNLIGLGDWEEGKSQIKSFIREMDLGDIVLVKRGQLVLALVEVVGEARYETNPNKDLDWFENRRKIKILEILETKKYDFPQARGTLNKSIGKDTKTYQYINDWYHRLVPPPKSIQAPKIDQLSRIYIDNYRMFKDFELSFLNKKGEVIPLIILAGINGSGKTTLLEYIDTFNTQTRTEQKDFIEIKGAPFGVRIPPRPPVEFRKIYKFSRRNQGRTTGVKEFKTKIKYLKVTVDSIEDTQKLIVDYSNKLIKNDDLRPSEAYEKIRTTIEDIFSPLDLNISFSRLDEKDNVFFINQEKEFPIRELSTGEQTLLSKVFNLYIGDYSEKIILIDEPELSLHPAWQAKVLEIYENFCNRHNSQIIIATHSPQIIGSAKRESLRILSMKEGQTQVIDDSDSYGRDVNWILKYVMGVPSTRVDRVSKKIKESRELLNEEKYIECEESLNAIEKEIGENDPEILQLRNILFFEQE